MALTGNNDWSPADVAAVAGNNDGFNGNGIWWMLVLFILFGFGNGWGNGYGGCYGQGNVDGMIQRGFDQSAVINGLNGISAGLNNMQLANAQQMFALQNQFANGFCDNRLGIANLQATIVAENCADREALNNASRDIIANQNSGIQAIIDKMCQQELDAERRENQNLRTQLNLANLAASQNAQTATILADNAAQTTAIEQYLNPTPVPSYQVPNPHCCNNNNFGCGYGF